MSSVRIRNCLSEDGILSLIDRRFPNAHPEALLGRGDDCAIFRKGEEFCTSADLFIEHVHFRRSYFEPQEIGHKALAVNISDLAAMGAKPFAFTLSLGIPRRISPAWLERFFDGMEQLATQQGMILAGGDICRSDSIVVSITVFGRRLPERAFMLRGGSIPGDSIFIIGAPGLARVGLQELEAQGRKALESWPAACAAHLAPQPQTSAGLMLARAAFNSRPPALMDVSDGLARDLPRLLGHTDTETGLGAEIEIPDDMLHGETLRHAALIGRDPAYEAFLGGEDYILLGACAPDLAPILNSAIPEFRVIGEVTPPGPVFCNGADMSGVYGFDHFAKG